MNGKIALEEHFLTPELEGCVADVGFPPDVMRKIFDTLEDVDGRLLEMDRAGIEIALLSLVADGSQGVADAARAVETARFANDALAEIVARHPDRFAGFAAVAMQDPAEAAAELERAVRSLGMRGALINGYSNVGDEQTGVYYDGEEYLPFWEAAVELGVPVYLHPRNPLPGQQRIYAGREELLGAPWAFGVETATHALRLISSGLFDRVPGLQIILGHLGEQVPFAIDRFEKKLAINPRVKLDRPPTQVLRENFHVTTSGTTHTTSLHGVIEQMGADRVMFAIDYPFESTAETAEWFDGLELDGETHAKIARGNAVNLLGLDVASMRS